VFIIKRRCSMSKSYNWFGHCEDMDSQTWCLFLGYPVYYCAHLLTVFTSGVEFRRRTSVFLLHESCCHDSAFVRMMCGRLSRSAPGRDWRQALYAFPLQSLLMILRRCRDGFWCRCADYNSSSIILSRAQTRSYLTVVVAKILVAETTKWR